MSGWRVYVVAGRTPTAPWRLLTKHDGVEVSRVSSRTRDRACAEELARVREEDLASAAPPEPQPARVSLAQDPTLHALVAAWAEHRAEDGRTAPKTLDLYRLTAKRLEGSALGSVHVSDLRAKDVVVWRDQLVSRLAASSVTVALGHVRQAWGWAVERELIRTPWPRVRAPRPRPTIKRPWRAHELELWLRWISERRPHHLPVVELLADVGARVSEVVGLRERDVDRARHLVHLARTKGGVPRTVAASPRVLDLIPQRDPDAYLFPGRKRATHLTANALNCLLRDARPWLREQGIPDVERLDLHSLRRAWVADAHAAGVPLDVARRQTGHRSLRVHLDYARHADVDLAGAVERVHQRRGGVHRLNPKGSAVEAECEPLNLRDRRSLSERKSLALKLLRGGSTEKHGSAGGGRTQRQDASWCPLPHAEVYADWIADHPEALDHLLTDPVVQLALRKVLAELRNEDAPTRQAKDTG